MEVLEKSMEVEEEVVQDKTHFLWSVGPSLNIL